MNMKLKNIKEVEEFRKVIHACAGDVYLKSQDGDVFNLKSALSAKAAAGEILVVDGLAVEEIKTAPVKAFLTKIGAEGKALLVTEQVDEKVVKSSRNIPGVSSTIATILSPYMILTHRVLVVDKAALQKIEEVYA